MVEELSIVRNIVIWAPAVRAAWGLFFAGDRPGRTHTAVLRTAANLLKSRAAISAGFAAKPLKAFARTLLELAEWRRDKAPFVALPNIAEDSLASSTRAAIGLSMAKFSHSSLRRQRLEDSLAYFPQRKGPVGRDQDIAQRGESLAAIIRL